MFRLTLTRSTKAYRTIIHEDSYPPFSIRQASQWHPNRACYSNIFRATQVRTHFRSLST